MAGLVAVGCALPQSPIPTPDGTLLAVTRDAMQYRSALPRDVHLRAPPREARGEACRTMLAFPGSPPTVFMGSDFAARFVPDNSLFITAGNDGYTKAIERAQRSVDGAPLFDVRADMHTTAVLSIVRIECIEVHALAAQ